MEMKMELEKGNGNFQAKLRSSKSSSDRPLRAMWAKTAAPTCLNEASFKALFIYEQRPIGRCEPCGQKQQRPRGSQPSCDMDADQL